MTAPSIETVEPLSVEELYRVEKARRDARKAEHDGPALAAAAAELQRVDDAARAARKGGRPKGRSLVLGSQRFPRGRQREPDPEMPGRPERLDLYLGFGRSPRSQSHSSDPITTEVPMRKSPTFPPRNCARCDKQFIPSGSRQRHCGADCKAADGQDAPAARKTAAKVRKRVERGYKPAMRRSAGGGAYQSAIEQIQAELETINARKAQLTSAMATLQQLGGVEA